MNAFTNYKFVLRIFQDANEAKRRRAMVNIKTIFHFLIFFLMIKNPQDTQSSTLEADLSLFARTEFTHTCICVQTNMM